MKKPNSDRYITYINKVFTSSINNELKHFKLITVDKKASENSPYDSFSLRFQGPTEPHYLSISGEFTTEDGEHHALLLTPIYKEDACIVYEAVFNVEREAA